MDGQVKDDGQGCIKDPVPRGPVWTQPGLQVPVAVRCGQEKEVRESGRARLGAALSPRERILSVGSIWAHEGLTEIFHELVQQIHTYPGIRR